MLYSMDNLIEIAAFSVVNDAYILRSLLESKDIHVYIQDENMAPFLYIGGVKVLVSNTDLNKAKEVMEEYGYQMNEQANSFLDETPAQTETPRTTLTSKTGIRIIAIVLIVILVVLLLVFNNMPFIN